jgi:hypothetical protein
MPFVVDIESTRRVESRFFAFSANHRPGEALRAMSGFPEI